MQHGIRCATLVRMEQTSEAGYASWLRSVVVRWRVAPLAIVYRIAA